MTHLMEMRNITKQFGSFKANTDVSIYLDKGEVLTLLGENGAGKSTLMNCLCGLYKPTEGSIYINGEKVEIDNPSKAVSLGIGMVHQHFMLIENMTVFENIILGKTGRSNDKKLFIDKKELQKEITELCDKYGLHVALDSKLTDISIGEQQRVEILKALYRGADILILDEPTAVLTDEEVAGLYDIIQKLKTEGKSIIFISHKMKEVMHLSDRITILRSGVAVDTVPIHETSAQELANLMVGRELTTSKYEKVTSNLEPFIELKDVNFNPDSKHNSLRNINLKILPGEILGIAGVDGNGQSQLALLLTGLIKPVSGELYLYGKKVEHFKPNEFIKEKIGHIPEDRNRMGLVGDMTISDNLILKSTNSEEFSTHNGLQLKKKSIQDYALKMKEEFDIRASDIGELTKNLSGGNQQKVILARELDAKPKVLVAVHPTRGLDIGATQFVHDSMVQARNNGCAILMISADLDEVLKVSDRLIVMYEGKIMDEFSGKNPPMYEISQAMAGKQNINI
ncbi:ABC transporter ATP-binding protein [Gallicola sp. Sow4_E12]|uniref:ABC transporter ATP-binding protein n=1 Tax=Gallicola sp. Sow4_E12 TaxID=3438785 RepID=UPI003F935D7F